MASVPVGVSARPRPRPDFLGLHIPDALGRVGIPARLQLGSIRKEMSFRVLAAQQADPSSSSPVQSSRLQRQAPPIIELEFVGPDPRQGENEPPPPPAYCTAVSGQKLLRNVMLENNIELYGPYGKMMNCEGKGMCGTCLVDILEGAELMNKRTDAEPYYLKLRPDSWRLACQATIGDGTNGGKIKVKRRPQKGNPLM